MQCDQNGIRIFAWLTTSLTLDVGNMYRKNTATVFVWKSRGSLKCKAQMDYKRLTLFTDFN